MSLRSTVHPLYNRLPIIFNGCFAKVTIGFVPTRRTPWSGGRGARSRARVRPGRAGRRGGLRRCRRPAGTRRSGHGSRASASTTRASRRRTSRRASRCTCSTSCSRCRRSRRRSRGVQLTEECPCAGAKFSAVYSTLECTAVHSCNAQRAAVRGKRAADWGVVNWFVGL